MKIYLEIEIPDGTAPKGISEHWIPENVRVSVETNLSLNNYPDVVISIADDPNEQYNLGYDAGRGSMYCEMIDLTS